MSLENIDAWSETMEKQAIKDLRNKDLRFMMQVYFFTMLTIACFALSVAIVAFTIYSSRFEPLMLLWFLIVIFAGIKANSKRNKVCEKAQKNYEQLEKVAPVGTN